MKLFPLILLTALAAVATVTAADFHTPVSITSPNSTAYYPLSQVYQGPGVGYDATPPHDSIAGGAQTWVTNQSNGGGYYYANGVPAPILIIDLGANRNLTEISTWGYADSNANGVRTFNLRFATETEGSGGFGLTIPAQTGFTANQPTLTRHSHPLTPVMARYVEFTATNNYSGVSGAGAGGDRVGLGEIAFENTGLGVDPYLEILDSVILDLDGTLQQFELSLHNGGATQNLTVASVVLGGTQAAAFSVVSAPATIAPGTTGTVLVSFNPAGLSGTIATTLTLTTNDPTTPVREISLSGFLHEPRLAVAATLDFGAIAPDSSVKTLGLVVSNAGNLNPLQLTAATLGGGDSASYSVDFAPTTVPPGGTLSVPVSLLPSAGNGTRKATLTFASNDPRYAAVTVNLTGRVVVIDPTPSLRINEFVASNSDGLKDGDGNRPDWIELHNTGTSAVELAGWHLTDKATNLTKWTFPSKTLAAGQYLVVFASAQSTSDYIDAGGNLHTNFNLSAGGEYLALVKPDGVTIADEFHPQFPPQFSNISYGSQQNGALTENAIIASVPSILVPPDGTLGLTWTARNFTPATGWFQGTGQGIGYNTGNDYTPLITTDVRNKLYDVSPRKPGLYIRFPFTIADKTSVVTMKLRMRSDDGFVAYLNGTEVARRNAPATPVWNSLATANASPEPMDETTDISINIVDLQNGDNVLAIHGMNVNLSSSDLLMLPQLDVTYTAPVLNVTGYLSTPTPGAANATVSNPGPYISTVTPTPAQSVAGQATTITAAVSQRLAPTAAVTLRYRAGYAAESTLPMVDDGTNGDTTVGDGLFTAIIPAAVHMAGDMLRWAITATDTAANQSRAPAFLVSSGTQQSPEYFGTVIPGLTASSQLPHFQWFTQDTGASHTRTGARASVYFAGRFYDNIYVRQRGGATNGTISQKFEFNKGEELYISDTMPKLSEININGNGSDSSFARQPLAFRTYQLTGNAACNCELWEMRVNKSYDRVGVFVEQMDESFLSRNGYDPEGDLYKVTGYELAPSLSTDLGGFEKKTGNKNDHASFSSLIAGLNRPTSTERRRYVIDELDMPQVLNFLALRSITQDADDVRKNYFVYRDTRGDQRWRIFPWDKDWTFGITGDGGTWLPHPFFADEEHAKQNANQWNVLYDVMFEETTTQRLYLRRLRTLMDTVLPSPVLENRAAAIIAPASPRLSTNLSSINNYLTSRRVVLANNYSTLIPASQPANPTIAITGAEFNPPSGNQDHEYIALTNQETTEIDISGWSISGAVTFTFQQGTVIERGGNLYISPNTLAFRQRLTTPTGNEERLVVGPYSGHLSNFGETINLLNPAGTVVATYQTPIAPSPAQLHLVISEIMYHPADPNGEAEFIELMNTSSTLTLDLTGIHFSEGIAFTFSPGTMLPPLARVVVVKNTTAFQSVFGNGVVIAGQFTAPSSLDNGGETLKLEDATGSTICQITYDDTAPWPTTADGGGASLHYIEGPPDKASSWFAFTPDPGAFVGDSDGDGQSDRSEWLAGTDPADPASSFRILSSSILPTGEFSLSFPAAAGHHYQVERSIDLVHWQVLGDELVPASTGPYPFTESTPPTPRSYYRVIATARP